MPSYYIKTYGCQMNKGDSDKLSQILESAGYKETRDSGLADIILVNTCVIRKNAEDKAAWYVKSLKGAKKKNKNLVIGLCGCLVTVPKREIKKDFPHVDFFIPPGHPEMLMEHLNPSPFGRGGTARRAVGEGLTKYLTIMEGCDNFCSYCIVPYVRGRERSRPIDDILREIKGLDFNHYKEIYLLGQNVNSYKYGLAELLRKIVESRKWSTEHRIRLMTSHPKDMSDEIINAVAGLPHVCEYFHLPIQHGDDKILKKMNRPYTVKQYRELVDKIRAKMPQAAITSDIIVGFPGETEKQFKNSCKIIKEIGFDAVNTAAYSARPGTAASKLKDNVPQKTKDRRLQEIMRVVDAIVLKRNKKLIGSIQEILVDTKEGGSYKGRTRTNKIVKFISNRKDLIGKLVDIKITSAKSWILEGDLVL